VEQFYKIIIKIMKISGQLVDVHKKDIYPAIIYVSRGKIVRIERTDRAPSKFILPGLIDAHIHIESSMVTPGAFAASAVVHGTTGVVSDPHEIANVMGLEGVKYMISDAKKVPLRFWFGAPSCVPATSFETSGAILNHAEVEKLLKMKEVLYLSEMMNFPGVIYDDAEVKGKIETAKLLGKRIDGHAPGLSGDQLKKYIAAGISTDHECSSLDEALEKISLGMKILIREGSAARNLEALKPLFGSHADKLMLCSDDLHPEMLRKRHINKIIAQLICDGYDKFNVIRSATVNPVMHYNLEAGLLRVGDSADFILVDSLQEMNVQETWISGRQVYREGKVLFSYVPGNEVNNFNCSPVSEEEIRIENKYKDLRIIEAFDGELLTRQLIVPSGDQKYIEADPNMDILKIVVKDRYGDSRPQTGLIRGFGLKQGAFASSVAHDSHNIISIGTNDRDIAGAINEVVKLKGGLSVSSDGKVSSLQLNIGGIMTTRSCDEVADDYEHLNELVRSMMCTMKAPFMTLSFMGLLVIPELKIGDKGLFDVGKFEIVSLFI
jgi:adenine deaminase